MAAEEAHAAEDPGVVADDPVIVRLAAPVPGVEAEAGDLVEAHRADEVGTHPRGAAGRDAAAALDAAVEGSAIVGDSMADLGAGRAAGLRVICVSYGYSPTTRLADHAPDALVDRMRDILPLFAG